MGFPRRHDYPSEGNNISAGRLIYIYQADPFRSEGNICREGGWWSGEVAVSIRVIHMYLIEGSTLLG